MLANATFIFPPPTDEMKRLSRKELKEQVVELSSELQMFEAKIDGERDVKLNDDQRRALDHRATEEFKSLYLERAASLASAILAQVGPVEIPSPAENDMQGMMWFSSTRHGRSSLYFGKPIGLEPAKDVDNFLKFIAEKLSE
jgi:hypothetical protein